MQDKSIQPLQILSEEISNIENILLNFCLVTGLNAILVDKNGVLSKKDNSCDFCKIISSCENGQNKCVKTYVNAAMHATMLNQPFIFKCHAGLGAFAIPLRDRDSCRTVVCGQIVICGLNNIFWDEVWQMASNLNIDFHHLQKEANKLRIMSTNEVKAAVNVLYLLIQNNSMINVKKMERLKLEKIHSLANTEVRMYERNLHDLVERRKYDDFYYRYRALIAAIKIGARDEAMNLLSQALDNTAEKYSFSPAEFKTRVIEFVLKISREVAEFGVNLDALTSIDSKFVDEAFEINDHTQLRMCIFKVLNSYIDFVADKTMTYKYEYIVQHATEYINSNYEKELTVENIAKVIHVSHYYLCHTFKEIMNCSIKQYIIRIKIGKAQALLLNLNLTIDEICAMVGYKNNRHFVETFKKIQGVTPHQYRTNLIYGARETAEKCPN